MFEKIKKGWGQVVKYLPSISKRAKTAMKVVYIYGIGLFTLFLFILAAWCFDCYRTGTANTGQLITFFKEYSAPAVVGAVTFLAVFSIDKNEDGRPDAAERKAEEDEGYRCIRK